jgi:cation diffusion facilitator CzcD-associated flavoprotein CzcO
MSEPEKVDVVIIGGGQAGLARGYHTAWRGLGFVVLESHARVGDSCATTGPGRTTSGTSPSSRSRGVQA